jgi:hypothetical protein
MANPLRAARHWATVAQLEAYAGPRIEDFAFVVELGALFRWVVGSTATADGVTVIGHTGGTNGRWIRLRTPIKGDDLATGDATIHVTGNFLRVLPVSTLLANSTLTLGTTNAAEGDELTVTRADVEAFTYQIDNGGVGAGTLCTMPISTAYWADFYYDGTNWSMTRGGALPT